MAANHPLSAVLLRTGSSPLHRRSGHSGECRHLNEPKQAAVPATLLSISIAPVISQFFKTAANASSQLRDLVILAAVEGGLLKFF
jgi:hypothetical protein